MGENYEATGDFLGSGTFDQLILAYDNLNRWNSSERFARVR